MIYNKKKSFLTSGKHCKLLSSNTKGQIY